MGEGADDDGVKGGWMHENRPVMASNGGVRRQEQQQTANEVNNTEQRNETKNDNNCDGRISRNLSSTALFIISFQLHSHFFYSYSVYISHTFHHFGINKHKNEIKIILRLLVHISHHIWAIIISSSTSSTSSLSYSYHHRRHQHQSDPAKNSSVWDQMEWNEMNGTGAKGKPSDCGDWISFCELWLQCSRIQLIYFFQISEETEWFISASPPSRTFRPAAMITL